MVLKERRTDMSCNGLERKKYIFHTMVLKVGSCTYLDRVFPQRFGFSDVNSFYWLIKNVSNSGMGYWFIMCDLHMDLAWEFHFSNNTDMLQMICLLLITKFLSPQLLSYHLLFAIPLSMPICPQIQYLPLNVIYWPNEYRSHGPLILTK